MKSASRTASLALVAALAFFATGTRAALAQQGPPPPGYHDHDHDHNWDAPPSEYRDIQRRGYADGIDGARKDYGNHRRPDVNNRWEFRDPHVPPEFREDYRHAFAEGYRSGVRHFYNFNDMPPPRY